MLTAVLSEVFHRTAFLAAPITDLAGDGVRAQSRLAFISHTSTFTLTAPGLPART